MATIINEKLNINGEGAEITLDGLTFSGNGFVEVRNCSSLVIKNCCIYDMNCEGSTKNYWLKIYNDIPMQLIIEHNYFGDNPGTAGSMYNLLEMNATLMNGSSISYNYFSANCVTHNTINVYAAYAGATIKICGNEFEVSSSTVRIGVKGSPVCCIEARNNIIQADREGDDPRWNGLALVQPYGKQTTTFANMTIVMSGNTQPGDQFIYGYSGTNDTMMDETTMPKIIFNGKVIENVNIYH